MNDTPESDAASRQGKRRNRPPKRRCTYASYGTCTTCPEIAERRRAAERRNTTRPPRNPAGGYHGLPYGLPLSFCGRPSMSAATTATVHDIEVLLRVIAVRQLLDAYATGMLLSTSGSLDNLANVLQSAAQHQKAADAERRAA